MAKKLIVIGDSLFAEIAYEYFTHDSDYEVVGFAVERDFITKTEMFGLPIIPFEDMEDHFTPVDHAFYAALIYTQLNRLRKRLYLSAKARGYTPASYISSRAFVWQNAKIGEHCFIFEDNTIQPFVEIGDNVVLWSGNHIGHHTKIGSHNFISSHVVLSGVCNLGENGFYGVNATVGNNVTIGDDCLLGAGAVVTKDVAENNLIKPNSWEVASVTPRKYFKVDA